MPSVLDLIPGVGTAKLVAGGLAVLAVAALVGWVGYVVEDRKVAWAEVQTERVQLDRAQDVNKDLNEVITQLHEQQIKDDRLVADVSAKTEARTEFVAKAKQEIRRVYETETVPVLVVDPAVSAALQQLRERAAAPDARGHEDHQAPPASVRPVVPTKP